MSAMAVGHYSRSHSLDRTERPKGDVMPLAPPTGAQLLVENGCPSSPLDIDPPPMTALIPAVSICDDDEDDAWGGCPPYVWHQIYHPPDTPSICSLTGLIVGLIFAMLTSSLVICMARCDFNFVFYLMAYYVWCIESMDHQTIMPSTDGTGGFNRSYRSIQHVTFIFIPAVLLDIAWLLLGYATWRCDNLDKEKCFDARNIRMKWTYGLHQIVLTASLFNLCLKAAFIGLSYLWLHRTAKRAEGQQKLCSASLVPAIGVGLS